MNLPVAITPDQIKGKPKKVGELGDAPVMQFETKGGLFMLMSKSGGKPRILGAGSHPGVAAHIAERDFPHLKLTELSKSEPLDPHELRREVAYWLPITRRMQNMG